MKKRMALVLCLMMLLTLIAGCSGGTSNKPAETDSTAAPLETVKISYWIPVGEDSTYYLSYEENPAVKYLETLDFGGKRIDLKFTVPITGKELDNFNTLLMTDEYCGLMDMGSSTTYASELLEDGYIHDLTPYVEQYMPNYMALLKAYPHLEPYVYSHVGDEKKILSLYAITDETLGNFMGFLYRRDWVAKYGTNPQTGAAFTYSYTDPEDYNTYQDDVVFPSGGTDPKYISDWEWMFGIFDTAMADLGITNGYCYAPYFKGFGEDGTLFNAFGGSNPMWYKDPEGNAAFGGASESMKSYLECLSTWYQNGWIDKEFTSHTNDAAYAVDSAKVHMGKVGLWIGRRAETGGQMDTGEHYTDGIMVYGACPPINDLYGAEETRNQTPYSLYQYSQLRSNLVVSNKVSKEDLPTVLTFLDYLYSAEGGALLCLGLTKEQFEVTQDASYIKYGLQDGAYTTETNADGTVKYIRSEGLLRDNNLASAMAGKRMTIGWYAPGFVTALNQSYVPKARDAMAQWDFYVNTGTFDRAIRQQFTPGESSTYNKVHANVDTFMSSNIPRFIIGEYNVHNEKDWQDYQVMLGKYGPDKITKVYERILKSE